METKAFPGLHEELPFIATYLLISLKRDKDLFKAYSPVYNDEFIAEIEARKALVDAMILPQQLTGEMKLITKLVSGDYKEIRGIVNRIESYLDLATAPLTMAPADFGIRQVRDELDLKNDEGIVLQLKALFNNVENNKTALEPVGYTPEISAKFSDLITKLGTDSVAQTNKKDSRIALTQKNIKTMNNLWALMSDVLEDGKKIAREKENDSMLLDYTFTYLQKKVRQDRKDVEPSEPPAA